MEEGQRSPGCRSGHSVKGNTVLNIPVGATVSPVPQTPRLFSQTSYPGSASSITPRTGYDPLEGPAGGLWMVPT